VPAGSIGALSPIRHLCHAVVIISTERATLAEDAPWETAMREDNADGGVAVAAMMAAAVLIVTGLLMVKNPGGETTNQPSQSWAIDVRVSLAR
jgi:hypothetical protein